MDDTDIVHRINKLSEEEHGLERPTKATSFLLKSASGCTRSKSPSTSAGTSCVSAGPGATRARTPTTSRSGLKTWSRVTANEPVRMTAARGPRASMAR